eukprot:2745794-Pyramimonas_sp.AAC.1
MHRKLDQAHVDVTRQSIRHILVLAHWREHVRTSKTLLLAERPYHYGLSVCNTVRRRQRGMQRDERERCASASVLYAVRERRKC